MILTPSQNKIAADLHRFRVVCCGRRFGKTTEAIEEIKGKAIAKVSRIAYIAPTYQQARDIAWEQLKKEFYHIANSINESRLEIRVRTISGGESIIILRGWESIETLRGQQFDFIVIDEIASMRNWWVQWEEVIRPTLTDTKGEALFISTPKGFNHFYDLYNKQEKDNDYQSFHFTTYDNPFIPSEEIDKARLEMSEDRFAQEYLADFRKMEGLVYKEFSREKHAYTNSVFGRVLRLVSVDFGFTNPAAIYTIDVDSDRNYWISSEYYKTQKTNAELVEYMKPLGGNKFYPDPAEPDRIEEMRRAGLNIMEVSKDIEAGITSVIELLKTNRLHVHSSCVNLISEFETYHYPDKKPDKNEPELPVKENDHGMDSIRYALHMQEPTYMNTSAPTYYPSTARPTNPSSIPQVPGSPDKAPTFRPKFRIH